MQKKRALNYVIAGAILLLPMAAMAAILPDQLVPCTGTSASPCDACALVTLADNILQFLIYLSVFVAVVAFTWAGFLFVTAAGNESKITKAKGTFSAVAIGFIIVLASWLIIDTVLRLTPVGGVDEWVQKVCTNAPQSTNPPPTTNPPPAQSQPEKEDPEPPAPQVDISDELPTDGVSGDDDDEQLEPNESVDPTIAALGTKLGDDTRSEAQKKLDEEAVRAELLAYENPIKVNKSNCGVNERFYDHSGGCTDVSRMSETTRDAVFNTADECADRRGSSCDFVLTGGSELGHKRGTEAGTHGGGHKFDVRPTADIQAYVNDDTYFRDVCFNGRCGRQHKLFGDFWVREDVGVSNDHYDVVVFNQ